MIKGGKIWAQPPICKVAKPQYVFYSTPCTWHLYENIKQEESSNLYRNSWQGRPAFSISTHIEAHIRNTSSHFQDIQSFKYEIQDQKRKTFCCFPQQHEPRLWSGAGWRRNLFLFHLDWDSSTNAKICDIFWQWFVNIYVNLLPLLQEWREI